ncbi:excalibur calcium-binding domain-containing protein [Hyphomicrobium sp. DMF-1]|jgi:hypothetical protein|uniref:excalibur calcium-binding domain-containing protein n=1 Tax=Hyphomicrobium sp. DMF-1 TaxID=3019544 RepID=UPI0022EC0195|nr:excalibur calcium-binding domain-containing protein [Hyphomicrobium sp. DMF-1]WBT39179.1 excalibur calcium-binding domain-containing protein [Hyphomicrobium sp. DMF-1]
MRAAVKRLIVTILMSSFFWALTAIENQSNSRADQHQGSGKLDRISVRDGSGQIRIAQSSLCGTKRLCGDMETCAEAHYYLTSCGVSSLDRNGDGIPCETLCGKTQATMSSRLLAQPFMSAGSTASRAVGLMESGAASFSCGTKRTCKQMTTCEEATFYLEQCGVKSLDGNGDGIACNGLCK